MATQRQIDEYNAPQKKYRWDRFKMEFSITAILLFAVAAFILFLDWITLGGISNGSAIAEYQREYMRANAPTAHILLQSGETKTVTVDREWNHWNGTVTIRTSDGNVIRAHSSNVFFELGREPTRNK